MIEVCEVYPSTTIIYFQSTSSTSWQIEKADSVHRTPLDSALGLLCGDRWSMTGYCFDMSTL